MRNFLSLFIGMGLLCAIVRVNAQPAANRTTNAPTFETYEEATQYAFSSLDQSKITTGILYDRAFKSAHLDVFQATENSNAGHWSQAYFELYNASNNNTQMLTSENMDNLIYDAYNRFTTVSLGVLAAEFNVLNYDAVETTSTGLPYQLKSGYNSNQTFLEKQVIVAAPLIDEIPMGTTTFSLPRWATISFGTNYVTSISVNFGDGNPVRNFYPGSNLSQSASYNSPGEKPLQFTINMSNGTQKTAKATIDVNNSYRVDNTSNRIQNYPKNDFIGKIDSGSIWATIPFKGYDEASSSLGYGQYLTYYAAGRTQIRKPIIIIDGFDPGNTRSAEFVYDSRMRYIFNGPKKLGDELRADLPGNGYDVIILDLPKYEYISNQYLVCDPNSNRCNTVTVKEYRNGGVII